MKLFSFAALLAALAVLSCNGENSVSENDSSSSGSAENCTPAPHLVNSYKGLDSICKTEAKKFVAFVDSYYSTINWDYVYSHSPGYVPGSGQVSESNFTNIDSADYTIVNDIIMNREEYDDYKKEYWRKYYEELYRAQREIPAIPCIVRTGVALLTDEEIAEFKGKYDKLVIEDYKEIDRTCINQDKRMTVFTDLSLNSEKINWDYVYSHLPGYVPGSGQISEIGFWGDIIVNDIIMTQAEYDVYKEEYWRKYYEEYDKNIRKMSIPCIVNTDIALLTDEEIAELKEKYKELAFRDYVGEPVPGIVYCEE